MQAADARNLIYVQLARVAQALAAPGRLRLLDLLCQGEKSVDVLARQAGQSLALASAHLKVLREAKLVEARRDGRHVLYRIAGEAVERFWLSLRELGQGLIPEVREMLTRFFDSPEDLKPVDWGDLIRQVQEGAVTLIDVRTAQEFAQGHLPGAVSIPFDQLGARLASLPRSGAFAAYCRGPLCVTAVNAVALMRSAGLNVKRICGGVSEWKEAGHPLEVSSKE